MLGRVMLWLLILVIVLVALFGGLAVNGWIFLLLILALVLLLAGAR